MKYSILTFAGLSAMFLKHELQNGLISRVTVLIDEVSMTSRFDWNKTRNEFLTDLILQPLYFAGLSGIGHDQLREQRISKEY